MGDSIAYGYALEQDETISARMQALWPEYHAGEEVEVVNAGVSGYATQQQTRWLARLAPQLEPNRVLLFFCIGNDIVPESLESYHARRSGLFNPGYVPMAMPPSPLQLATERSALAFGLIRFVARKRHVNPDLDPDFPGLRFTPLERFLALPDAEREVHYAAVAERLAAFEGLAASIGAPAALVLFPEQVQVEGRLSLEPIRRVREIALQIGLPALDLLDAFRAARESPIRAKDGTHPNRAGAELAAREIIAFLSAHGSSRAVEGAVRLDGNSLDTVGGLPWPGSRPPDSGVERR